MPVQVVLALWIEVWVGASRLREERFLIQASQYQPLPVHFVRLALDVLQEQRLWTLAAWLALVEVQEWAGAVELRAQLQVLDLLVLVLELLLQLLQHEDTEQQGHRRPQLQLFQLVLEVVVEVPHLDHEQQVVVLAELSQLLLELLDDNLNLVNDARKILSYVDEQEIQN